MPILMIEHPTPDTSVATSGVSREPDAPAVALEAVCFGWAGNGTPDLEIENLQIAPGERLFVEGPSGSGKSTLLGLLAGVTTPQEGSVTILGETISGMGAARRDHFRADHIGYLFQMFNLIPYLTVTENVTLPLRFSALRSGRVANPDEEAKRLLEHLGMGDYLHRPVTKLSVGQQQRVAAARALIGAPEIILADEPTSSLDAGHSEGFIKLLFEECRKAGTTLVFVSHDRALGKLFDRRVVLGK
jgi:putative ABC transport system ATP-binding protein